MWDGLFYHPTKYCWQVFHDNAYKSRVVVMTGGWISSRVTACDNTNPGQTARKFR